MTPRTKRAAVRPRRKAAVPDSSSSSEERPGDEPVPHGAPSSSQYDIIFRDAQQEARFQILIQRQIVNTRYMHPATVQELGFTDDLIWLFANIGWEQFSILTSPTYPKITLEFLSSLDVKASWYSDEDPGVISFRLGGRDHTLSLAQIRGAYGFPAPCSRLFPSEYVEDSFWKAISGERSYSTRTALATSIDNPVLRYVHRMMAHTIFGRAEGVRRVGSSDLFFLWSMLHAFKVDSALYLIKHLHHVAQRKKGNIVIGGLITPIAQLVGVAPRRTAEASGSSWLDLEACRAMHLIITRGRSHFCIFADGRVPLPLPDPERTTVRLSQNWLMPTEGTPDPAVPDPAPSAPAPSSPVGSSSFDSMMTILQEIRQEQTRQGERMDRICEEQVHQREMVERMDTSIQRMQRDWRFLWGARTERQTDDDTPSGASGSKRRH